MTENKAYSPGANSRAADQRRWVYMTKGEKDADRYVNDD